MSIGGIVKTRTGNSVTLRRGDARVVTVSRDRRVVMGGRQGIAGVNADTESYVAAEDINGHRAVGVNELGELVLATASGSVKVIGFIRDAVLSGGSVTVYRRSKVGGFSGLTPGSEYFVSETGSPTATPPPSGVLQEIGIAVSATEMAINIGDRFIF